MCLYIFGDVGEIILVWAMLRRLNSDSLNRFWNLCGCKLLSGQLIPTCVMQTWSWKDRRSSKYSSPWPRLHKSAAVICWWLWTLSCPLRGRDHFISRLWYRVWKVFMSIYHPHYPNRRCVNSTDYVMLVQWSRKLKMKIVKGLQDRADG